MTQLRTHFAHWRLFITLNHSSWTLLNDRFPWLMLMTSLHMYDFSLSGMKSTYQLLVVRRNTKWKCCLLIIWHVVTVYAVATDFRVFFFSVSMITHELLHSAWWNFAGTSTLTTAWALLNFKVMCQRSRSFFHQISFTECEKNRSC